MTIEELYTRLEEKTGLQVSYRVAPVKDSALPYINIFEENAVVFYADGIAYYNTSDVTIEVYDHLRNRELENLIESEVLTNVTWERVESSIDSEELILTEYSLTL